MRILCTQEFPGDRRMLGSVARQAPEGWDIELLPPLAQLTRSLPRLKEISHAADALLTCHLWAPATLKAIFPHVPMVVMPHNACPVKAHYWFPDVLQQADLLLVTGRTLDRKTRLLHPAATVANIPYPRLDEYRQKLREAKELRYDLVFACTAYSHYEPLMGIPESAACWHDLIGELAARGFRIAALRHQDDFPLDPVPGVEYFDQPNPEVLFSGRAIVSDIASNGLLAAALGRPVFQAVDRQGEVVPHLASHRGFLPERFEIGPRLGAHWTVDNLERFHPFGDEGQEHWVRAREHVAGHIHQELGSEDFFTNLTVSLEQRAALG